MRSLPLAFRAGLLVFAAAAPVLADDHWPAPVQALADQGLTIHAEFSAPGGLTGYAASAQGRELAVYVTADGEHAVVGTLVDAEGNDLSSAPLDEHVRAAQTAELWKRLENSHWILDGDPDAQRVVYTFTDPNCPFCRQLWKEVRPWVEAGEVQLRHIMVGVLGQDSPAKAAALLGADDPASALHEHESGESIAPSAQPREIEEQVYDNNQLFEELGLIATPTTMARDGDRLIRTQGMPDDEHLLELMGGAAP
ncbi:MULTISPECIES: thiol:disulfide interchange protein DsbG [Halomonas]|uniref:Thiol:disulfide interchange protein n=1 Tax=Halomonas flagellata TaxID=2920385 RepID=A0ABS9RUF7_9GAMM|nr:MULTISPECIES: thiol:disulfide interchange protein DsbG [Halomonas]MCH4563442.1 thiol:disulfide interchange protein DsbG [Halomonas flagellata]PXY00529.1 thiol:disulfide interchange protein DsbG [Halomonas sp. LBP4]